MATFLVNGVEMQTTSGASTVESSSKSFTLSWSGLSMLEQWGEEYFDYSMDNAVLTDEGERFYTSTRWGDNYVYDMSQYGVDVTYILLTSSSGSKTITSDTDLSGKIFHLFYKDANNSVREDRYITFKTVTNCTPPSNLKLSASQTTGSATLSWSAGGDGTNNPVTGYVITYQDSANGSTWGEVNYLKEVSGTNTTVDAPSTAGYYRRFGIQTKGSAGDDYLSTVVWSSALQKISYSNVGAPQTVSLSKNNAAPNEEVELSWNNASAGTNNSISKYEIYRATSVNGTYTQIATATTTAISGKATVKAPSVNGSVYYYKVKTIGSVSGYDSELSQSYASIECSYSAPSTPNDVTIGGDTVAYAKSDETVELSWSASTAGTNNPISGYSVHRDGVEYDVTQNTKIDVPANEQDGQYYTYTVYAKGAYASSGASNGVRVYTYSDPSIPQNILVNGSSAAFAMPNESVALSWDSADSGSYNAITGYRVYRNGEWYGDTTSTNMPVPAGENTGDTVTYSVETIGERSNSGKSSSISVYTYSAVKAPNNVSVSNLTPDSGESISVFWSGAESGQYNKIKGYKVYKDLGATGSYVLVASIESEETGGVFTEKAADDMGTACRYKISTVGEFGESGMSDVYAEYITKSYGACTPPTSITIDKTNAEPGDTATLYWSGAENGENCEIVGYAVYRSTQSERDYVKIIETQSAFASVLASDIEGQIYYFKVQSVADDTRYNSELSDAYAFIQTNVTTTAGGNSVPASSAFHAAIKNGEKQRALIYFYDNNLWITNDDIVSNGITYQNYFCSEEDMTIGLAPSSTVSFSIFNENRRLDNMKFGKFRVSIGTVTKRDYFYAEGNVTVIYDGDKITGHDDYPYVRVNGVDIGVQPDFPIKSIFAINDTIYCIGENDMVSVYRRSYGSVSAYAQSGGVRKYTWRQVAVMTWSELQNEEWGVAANYEPNETASINAIMLSAAERYVHRRVGVSVESDNVITDYLPNGTSETYTYVDLGIFYADKPEKTRTNIISVDGYDGMRKLEVSTENMPITFPITLYGLLDTVCGYVGVEHKIESFINQNVTLTSASDVFQSTTAREIIAYIAESACANAKFDYDGKLTFSWWSDSSLIINESDYSQFVPYEYNVKTVDRLQIRQSDNDIGILTGDGTNGYVIQENPFLAFSGDAEGQAIANPIYERLASFPEYTPGNAEWFGDWSYRPGDVITISYDGVNYRYPIFGYTLKWSGSAKISLESTGNEYRDVLDAKSRESWAVGRKMLEINKSIDGVKIIASEAKETSESAVSKVTEMSLTVDGIKTSVENVKTDQGTLRTEFGQTAEKIEAKVSKGEVIAAINLTAESAKIQAPKISLEGIVTANEKFKVLLDGSVEATDGKFSGTLASGNWSFDQHGSKYTNGSQTVNMTVMSGDFVGGGSGTRAFFGSTGLDVQYGADYDRTAFMRAGDIRFIIQNSSEMSDYASAGFKRSNSGEICFVCTESHGASNTDENSSGNLGYSDQYWDYTFTRVLRAGTYPGSSSRAIKQDIEPLGEFGEIIDKLEPVSFAYKSSPTVKRYGLIYEDVKPIMPVLCFDDGKGDPGIVYSDLIPVLLREIQSLRKRIKALEERM